MTFDGLRKATVLIDWHGIIVRGQLAGSVDGDLHVTTRGFALPRGAPVSVRRVDALRAGTSNSEYLWRVDACILQAGEGLNYQLVLVRASG